MRLKEILRNVWIKTTIIVLVSFLLSVAIKHEILSISNLFPFENATNFKTSDLYSSILHRSPVHRRSKDVVVVAVDQCDRGEIVQCIDNVMNCSPSVVAIDIIFESPHPSDSLLMPLITDSHLVFANHLLDVDPDADAKRSEYSFFHDVINENVGAINLPSAIIRNFQPLFTLNGTRVYNCFAGAAVKLYDPNKMASLMSRSELRNIPIVYHKVDFDVITSQDVLSYESSGYDLYSAVNDKIVLVGKIDDPSDKFPTPIADEYPGILVHANIIDTILQENYIEETRPIVNYIISILTCFIFLLLTFFLKEYVGDLSNIIMRLVQIVILLVLYYFGLRLYNNNIYMNCLLPMLTIAFSTFVTDIYQGVEHITLKYGKVWIDTLKELL